MEAESLIQAGYPTEAGCHRLPPYDAVIDIIASAVNMFCSVWSMVTEIAHTIYRKVMAS